MLFLYTLWPEEHPEHFEEIRTLTKRCKQLKQEIEILKQDKQNLVAFESKSISAFTTAVTNRLIKAFPDRYNLRSAIGKIKLQKDIVTIRLACNGKIPIFTTVGDDRNQFLKLLEEQQNRFDEIDNTDIVKRGYRENAGTSTYISNDNSPNFTNINKISLPVKVKKSKKNRRRKYSSSSSSDNDSSSSSSSSDEGERRHDECISRRKHRGAGKKKRKYRKSRRHNSPSHAKKLHVMEEAVPSDNGICNAQREGTSAGTVPVGTIYDESNIINETNIDKNSGILSASSIRSLEWYHFHAASTRRAISTRLAWILSYKSTHTLYDVISIHPRVASTRLKNVILSPRDHVGQFRSAHTNKTRSDVIIFI